MRSKSLTDLGRLFHGFSINFLCYSILSKIIHETLPSFDVLRKFKTLLAASKFLTTILSNRPQQLVIISSYSRGTVPKSPRRPITPGILCCMIFSNILLNIPIYLFSLRLSFRLKSIFSNSLIKPFLWWLSSFNSSDWQSLFLTAAVSACEILSSFSFSSSSFFSASSFLS